MSLNMFLGEVNSQTESINQVYADGIEAMQQVIVAIELFYMDGKLQGKTYNSAKTYFKATYRPLAQGMICLCEDLIRLNSAFPEQFQAAVATTDVQEAEVEMQIQQANRHIREAEVLSAVSPTLASSIF
ncbi:LXG domain of WXG superfamily protein, partial [Evansella caseinilytica]